MFLFRSSWNILSSRIRRTYWMIVCIIMSINIIWKRGLMLWGSIFIIIIFRQLLIILSELLLIEPNLLINNNRFSRLIILWIWMKVKLIINWNFLLISKNLNNISRNSKKLYRKIFLRSILIRMIMIIKKLPKKQEICSGKTPF